jgi:hypothetical protein
MAPSQVALWASTGSPVIGVFQTLSLGNAGQVVPGSVAPGGVARPWGAGRELGEVVRDAEAPAVQPAPATRLMQSVAAAPAASLRDAENMAM